MSVLLEIQIFLFVQRNYFLVLYACTYNLCCNTFLHFLMHHFVGFYLWLLFNCFVGPNLYRGTLQHKGMAMVPKRALVVMGCEIARLLQLTQNAIVPISYCIQRKVGQLLYMCVLIILMDYTMYLLMCIHICDQICQNVHCMFTHNFKVHFFLPSNGCNNGLAVHVCTKAESSAVCFY